MDKWGGTMTLPTGHQESAERAAGFTLIELVLVMTMLVIVLSIAFPSLKGFFRGRHLDSEARRFLTLTRYGQSRAVAEGVPMNIWINPRRGDYGLEPEDGYLDQVVNRRTYSLSEDVDIEVPAYRPPAVTRSNIWAVAPRPGGVVNPIIRFLPDGYVSETSPDRIRLHQGRDAEVWLVETTNHLRYEIR